MSSVEELASLGLPPMTLLDDESLVGTTVEDLPCLGSTEDLQGMRQWTDVLGWCTKPRE